MGIGLVADSMLYISEMDRMGNLALRGFEETMGESRRRGVREYADVRVIRGIGFEYMGFERPVGR